MIVLLVCFDGFSLITCLFCCWSNESFVVWAAVGVLGRVFVTRAAVFLGGECERWTGRRLLLRCGRGAGVVAVGFVVEAEVGPRLEAGADVDAPLGPLFKLSAYLVRFSQNW